MTHEDIVQNLGRLNHAQKLTGTVGHETRRHMKYKKASLNTDATPASLSHLFLSHQSSSPDAPLQKPNNKYNTMLNQNIQLCLFLTVAYFLFFSVSATDTQSKVTNNPADQLVAIINDNRTAHHLTALYSNPGLACIALQYIKAYEGSCDDVGGPKAKKPEDSAFAETFAPECNVEPATLTQITGRFLGCQSEYIKPDRAFSELLMKDEKSLNILNSKNHSEVGAAVSGSEGGSPYFWCVLLSNGKSNSSFVLEDGVAKVSRPGCFSGANDDCNSARERFQSYHLWNCVLGVLAVIGFVFGVR